MRTFRYSVIVVFACIVCFSCMTSNTESEYQTIDSLSTEEISDTNVIDSEVEESGQMKNIEIDLIKLLSKIDTTYSTPFTLDSSYIERAVKLGEEKSTLTNSEVQYLSYILVKNEPTDWSDYSIHSFIKIDSMRLMGTYDNYLETIDIGMTKECEAHIHSKIELNPTNFILLWSVSYSSYEACPYSSGTVIFGTLFSENKMINTATLGEESGGGDAPYWGDVFITSQINSTAISTRKIDESGGDLDEETGEEIVDKTDKTFNLKITNSGLMSIESE